MNETSTLKNDTQDHPLRDIEGLPEWVSVVKAYQACDRVMQRELGKIQVSLPQYDILACLLMDNGVTQQQLAERNMIVKSNVSGLVQRMERDGLVSRANDPDDARKRIVMLTAEGRSRALQAAAIHKQIVELMMTSVPAEKSRLIAEGCRAIERALKAAYDQT